MGLVILIYSVPYFLMPIVATSVAGSMSTTVFMGGRDNGPAMTKVLIIRGQLVHYREQPIKIALATGDKLRMMRLTVSCASRSEGNTLARPQL
jgi:hypothetical protein